MASSSMGTFSDDGFLVVEGLLNSETCAELLDEVIQNYGRGEGAYIHESEFRFHAPMQLRPPVEQVLRTCVRAGYALLDAFLSRRRFLVELSSITVFPNARQQPMHFDEAEKGKNIVSVFVNPLPTAREAGALSVIPGSHRSTYGAYAAPRVLELPPGSAVFMNGKLRHCGTGNSSIDRVRPILYFSFGDDDIVGPAYSLRPEYRRKYQLSDFFLPPLTPEGRPRLTAGRWIAVELASREHPSSVFIMRGSHVERVIDIAESDRWMVPLFEALKRDEGYSVGTLRGMLDADEETLLTVLTELGELGLVSW